MSVVVCEFKKSNLPNGLVDNCRSVEPLQTCKTFSLLQESLDSDLVVTAAVMEEYQRQHHDHHTEKSEVEIETFDCSSIVQHLKAVHRSRQFQRYESSVSLKS